MYSIKRDRERRMKLLRAGGPGGLPVWPQPGPCQSARCGPFCPVLCGKESKKLKRWGNWRKPEGPGRHSTGSKGCGRVQNQNLRSPAPFFLFSSDGRTDRQNLPNELQRCGVYIVRLQRTVPITHKSIVSRQLSFSVYWRTPSRVQTRCRRGVQSRDLM